MYSINSLPVCLRTEYETRNSALRSIKLHDNLYYYITNTDGGPVYCVVVTSVSLSVRYDVSPHFTSIVE
jgi:hypothetical protein